MVRKAAAHLQRRAGSFPAPITDVTNTRGSCGRSAPGSAGTGGLDIPPVNPGSQDPSYQQLLKAGSLKYLKTKLGWSGHLEMDT